MSIIQPKIHGFGVYSWHLGIGVLLRGQPCIFTYLLSLTPNT